MVLQHNTIVIDNWNKKSLEQVELIMDMRLVSDTHSAWNYT